MWHCYSSRRPPSGGMLGVQDHVQRLSFWRRKEKSRGDATWKCGVEPGGIIVFCLAFISSFPPRLLTCTQRARSCSSRC